MLMHSAVLFLAAVVMLAANAHAVPTIVVGNWGYEQNSGIQQIPIYVTGGPNDYLSGLNFVAMTGDGGPKTTLNPNDPTGLGTGQGVVPAPNITATIETDTSPWGPTLLTPENAHPAEDFGGGAEGTQTVMLSATTLTAELSLNGTHLLGIISVNTNNSGGNYFAVGEYHLDMGGSPNSDLYINNDGMPIPSNYSDGGPLHAIGQTYFNVTDGIITIPEPHVASLLRGDWCLYSPASLAIWRITRLR